MKIEDRLKKIKPKYYPLLAFLLTLITYTVALSYMGLLSNGKYIIARSDLAEQYIPFINMFCDVLKGKQDYWFSWYFNGGSGTALLYAYYTLSPFNLIYLLLGENHVMTATALVIILKASLASATFQIFVTRFVKRTGYSSVLFAMMYGLCGYQVCYYFNIIWMDAFYLMPILILLITQLIRKGKFLWLTPAYAFLFVTNFYSGYMAGMCSFLFFLFYSAYYKRDNGWKKTVINGMKFVSSVLLAIGMTAAIWLPAVYILFTNRSATPEEIQNTQCNPLFLYNNMFIGQMQSLHGVTPFIYCGIPVLMLLPLYFLNKKISIRERIYSLVFVLVLSAIMLIPVVNYAMHGMDDANMFRYRYAYFMSFILCIIGYRQSLYSFQLHNKRLYFLIAVNILLYILGFWNNYLVWSGEYNSNTIAGLLINICFMFLWGLVCLMFWKHKQNRITCYVLITFLLMTELGLNIGICISKMDHNAMEQEEYEVWEERYITAVNRLKADDSGLYRVEYFNNRETNDCMKYRYSGIQSFTSSTPKNWASTMEKMGFYRSKNAVGNSGFTDVTRTLLGVKYRILGETMEYSLDGNSYQPYEEWTNSLSIGYMVNEDITNYVSNDSPFQNQDQVLSLMCGQKIQCYEDTNTSLKVTNGIFDEQESVYALAQKPTQEPASFVFTVVPFNNMPLYVYFGQIINGDVIDAAWVDTPGLAFENNHLPFAIKLNPARIVKAGRGEDDKYHVSILFDEKVKTAYFTNAYFCFFDQKEYERAYQILRVNQLKITDYDKNSISGTIHADKGQILFTSIPYDIGWQAWIDGEKQSTISILEKAFLGLKVPEGEHEIVLKYEGPYTKWGMYISTACIMLFLGILAGKRMKRERKREFMY